jgi:hypothetical protein
MPEGTHFDIDSNCIFLKSWRLMTKFLQKLTLMRKIFDRLFTLQIFYMFRILLLIKGKKLLLTVTDKHPTSSESLKL